MPNPLAMALGWPRRVGLALRRDTTLGTLVERLAQVHGDRRLVTEDGGRSLTCHQAAERVASMAGGIRARLGPAPSSSRVVVQVENGYDCFLLCLAAARAGTVPVPVNSRASPAEVDQITADAGAALVVRSGDEVLGDPVGQATATASPGGVAAIFYTSGTTGRPKGAELTHAGLLGSWRLGALFPSDLRRDEVVCGLPVAHIAGFTVLVLAATLGVPVYLLRRFRAEAALDAIESRRATAFVGVPAMYRMMEEAGAAGRDLRSVRLWASGADAMPAELAGRFRKLGASATLPLVGSLGEAAFVDGYGMVELGGAVAARVSLPHLDLPLLPLPGYSLRVVSPEGTGVAVGRTGELAVRGPGILKGYHGDAGATAARVRDGWLRTGDRARRGPGGVVALVGREKDVIKRGGFSVFAAEVEHALERHPDVAEAAVVGLPDHRLGEVPAAAIRLRRGARFDEDALAAWAGRELAAYKVPTEFLVVDDLPRTGSGKVRKDEVRSRFRPGPYLPVTTPQP